GGDAEVDGAHEALPRMVSDVTKGSSRVAARICARWIDCGAAPVRPSLPPMVIRQEASPATTKSAPLATTLAALSVTIPSEGASSLAAKLPPKPQQESDWGRLATSMPASARSSFRGRGPTFSTRIEWQVGW